MSPTGCDTSSAPFGDLAAGAEEAAQILVPGWYAGREADGAWAEGRYGSYAGGIALGTGEMVLAVLTAGESATYLAGERAVAAAAARELRRQAAKEAERYLAPGVGAATRGQFFRGAWIQRDLFNNLQRLVGKADFNKFIAALNKGLVGPTGESGIKILAEPVRGFTHELKIGGSAQRLLGRINENGVLVFEELIRGGLH